MYMARAVEVHLLQVTGADDEAIAAELTAFEGAVLRACGARIRGVEGQ